MKTIIRKLGNSRGVLIPTPILSQVGLEGGTAELRVVGNTIVLRPLRKKSRAGWAQASERLRQEEGDALVWPQFTNTVDESLRW